MSLQSMSIWTRFQTTANMPSTNYDGRDKHSRKLCSQHFAHQPELKRARTGSPSSVLLLICFNLLQK